MKFKISIYLFAEVEIMQKQLDAGLDEINDGEMGRSHYATSALQRLSGLDGSLQGISERWSPPVLPWDGWMTIGGWALMGMIHLHSWHSNFWGQGPWGLAKNLLLGRFAAPIDVTWDQLSQGLTLTEKTEVSAASCSGFLADISWERFLVMFDELCPLSPLKGAVATWVEWGFQDAFQGWVPSVLRYSHSTWCGRVWSAN